MEKKEFRIILFETVSRAMKAEKLLKTARIPFKLIPIPKEISPECGICLRFTADCEAEILAVISGKIEFLKIVTLKAYP